MLGRDSPEGHITGASKRPKAAEMMVVRSGLRCPRCLLKAWVCLCNRAPIEIDRRRKKPSSCAHHIPLCLLRTISAMPTRQWTQHCLRTAHPGSESIQHHRWRAATPASTTVDSVPSSFLYRTSSNSSRAHSSTCKQLTRSVSVKVYPSPRHAPPHPDRGPKSAPEPRHDCSASITSYRLWGVRVSPLSAGGEGLCKAQSWLLNRPGKQAEGSQTQIGPFSCHRSTCSGHYQLSVLPQMEPWGSRLRIWKFKYKVVRFRIKRYIKLAVGFTSGSRPPKATSPLDWARTADTRDNGRSRAGRIAHTNPGQSRRLQKLLCLISCLPASGVHTSGEQRDLRPPQFRNFRVGKRAWINAQRQANQKGHTWYRGRLLCSSDIPRLTATMQPSSTVRRPRHGAVARGATVRLKIMTLNVGHMSAFLWGEIKAYLGTNACDYDVVCFQELHWSQTCQFSVAGWSAVVSAGKDRSDGIMVLVHPKFKQHQVKYDEIITGRVLRVQIAVDDSRAEIFCCYQHVWRTEITKEENLRKRQFLLDKLCTQVRAIAKRSTVVVLGDFNAELVPSQGRVGQSLANTPRHVGPEAPSPQALTRALEEMELVALNTWCSRSPHTNFTPTGNSQIDFIWVRAASADKLARQRQPADPAVGSWRYMGHKQLAASIRLIKHYHLNKTTTGQTGVDRRTLQEHVRINHPSTSELRSQVSTALSGVEGCAPASALRQLNDILLEASARIYPSRPKAREAPQLDFEPLWKFRDALRRHWRRDLQGLFKAWILSHRLARLAKDARRKQVELRRDKVTNILQSTQTAADEHRPHKVYQLVSQLKPWCPRPRPRLKSKKGELLTARGERDRLISYCRETFAPDLPIPATGDPRLNMTSTDWSKFLGQTKVGKAVPQGCAPAATWKACADLLGPQMAWITRAVEAEGTLPSEWCSPELMWLTKPNKAPDVPEHLRPIGLLTPTAKAAAAFVREQLMPGIQSLLLSVPQFAYLANRDIYDALARVNCQIADIKHSLAQNVANRFVQRQRRESTRCSGRWIQPIGGGAVLSVDLHKAFDMLTREQLLRTLSKLDAEEGIKNAAMLLRTQCQYVLVKDGVATEVNTTRGVRQGCRLAPALWSAVSGDILTQIVQNAFTGPITVFADDHIGAWTFHTVDDIIAMEQDVLRLFSVLSEAGLSVSPSKSKLVVQVQGAAAERYLADRTVHLHGQPHWCFGEGENKVAVPIVQEMVYLGTIVTWAGKVIARSHTGWRRPASEKDSCGNPSGVDRYSGQALVWLSGGLASLPQLFMGYWPRS